MIESTKNPDEPRILDDDELNEVSGGQLPDFVYELAEKFEPKKREAILRYFSKADPESAGPYIHLVRQLRSINDDSNAERVKEYFYEHYHRVLRGC